MVFEVALNPLISVIIPAINEAGPLPDTIRRALDAEGVEALLADGGSTDGTAEVAESLGARVVKSPPGRAAQMNRGAAAASGAIYLFLHADTLLPVGYDALVRDALSGGAAAGAFTLKINSAMRGLRAVEWLTDFRCKMFGLPYGDQAIFMRLETFRALGGYREMPIMEDYELMRRARKIGGIKIIGEPAITSARRWIKLGVLRTTLVNQAVILGYIAGVSPERLAKFYRGGGGVFRGTSS